MLQDRTFIMRPCGNICTYMYTILNNEKAKPSLEFERSKDERAGVVGTATPFPQPARLCL